MPENQSLVSVVLPVYNCERYLAQAIESVISQNYRPIEIIVVDDGSTDKSAETAKKFGNAIRYNFQQHAGQSVARNKGIDLAQGEFIAFLDADDIWESNKLALQVTAFENSPGVGMVFGFIRHFRSPELPEEVKANINCPEQLMPGYLPSAVVIKRDVFSRAGLFETNWQVGEFIDWFIRAREIGISFLMLPEPVALRRLYKSGDKSAQATYFSNYLKIIKSSLDRKRNK